MQNDRKIIISAAGSRTAEIWPAQELLISELWERLRTPTRGTETMEAYLRMKKGQQDALKDVGGYVAGQLRNNRRRAGSVESRDLLTLDLDNIPAGGTEDILRRVGSLGCGYCVYSTRKHRPDAPRLRVIIPLDRSVTADEYEPIARRTAAYIAPGMEPFDPSTFQASRLMYWPSCCADGQYIYQTADLPLLSADGVLAQYTDWRDCAAWPQVPGAAGLHKKLAAKQGDPLEKGGVVGAFCRTYSIYDVLDKFLPGVYIPTDKPDRWTFAGGSTAGGALIYDQGKYLYSHHATDPAGGRLSNAFDLCRLHIFGAQDEDAKVDTPIGRLPSYKAMLTFARRDPAVESILNRERYESAVGDFTASDGDDVGLDWMRGLQVDDSGKYARTIRNVIVMLEGDPRLRGRIRMNTFSGRIEGVCPLPWAGKSQEGTTEWTDGDDAGLRDCVEQLLGFHTKDTIDDALVQVAQAHAYNPVQEYLQSREWDSIPRLDTLFSDYFGDTDCPYTRAVARKSLVAAVARAMEPGCQYDQVPVVCGPQGIGKSTFFTMLGGPWFSNSVTTFDGKEAAEQIQGNWIIEIGELAALNRTETNMVKQMLSRRVDDFRAAYGRRKEKQPRRCVFFGTTNDRDYLKDPTGNRRYWPIDCVDKASKSVFSLTQEDIDQIWAEAFLRWQMGESLVLDEAEEEEAERRRQARMEVDDLRGTIEEFLQKPIPEDWPQWDISRRAMFWCGQAKGNSTRLIPRDRVCAIEVMRECLGDRRPIIPQKDSRRVNQILSALPGWEPAGLMRFGKIYGRQRGFSRISGVQTASTEQMATVQSVDKCVLSTDLICGQSCDSKC